MQQATATATNQQQPIEFELISLTELAATKVNEIRVDSQDTDEPVDPDHVLRVRVVGGGCAGFSYELYFDEQMATDKKFICREIDVVVDQMSLMYLVGTQIDYVEGLVQVGFKFNNPNVQSTCGCGSSFSV